MTANTFQRLLIGILIGISLPVQAQPLQVLLIGRNGEKALPQPLKPIATVNNEAETAVTLDINLEENRQEQ